MSELATALLTLVTVFLQWRVRRVVNRTHETVLDTNRSVGPANGRDLQDIARQVVQLEKYTHDSVHELRGKVGVSIALIPQVLDRLESIEKAVNERTT